MILKAYAKLNLALDVLGKRPDGYHELDMVMQSISLYDTVSVQKTDCISVKMDKADIDEKNNTAYSAAELFREYTGSGGAQITIEKRIPSMAGLGGSSADAAAVLTALDRLYGTNLSFDTLKTIGKRIGADVPFCLLGGTARARGIGERLEPLKLNKPLYFTVVKPWQGVSTKDAFAAYKPSKKLRMETIIFALIKGDMELYTQYSGNALGLAALSIAPEIMTAASSLLPFGKAFMSGSGSSMFCVFDSKQKAEDAAKHIKGDYELCGAFESNDKGIEILGENS